MPDHLGADQRKTKDEPEEDKPIQCKLQQLNVMYNISKNIKK